VFAREREREREKKKPVPSLFMARDVRPGCVHVSAIKKRGFSLAEVSMGLHRGAIIYPEIELRRRRGADPGDTRVHAREGRWIKSFAFRYMRIWLVSL